MSAKNAIHVSPDFKGPRLSESFCRSDGCVVTQMRHLEDHVGGFVSMQNANFVLVHGSLQVPHRRNFQRDFCGLSIWNLSGHGPDFEEKSPAPCGLRAGPVLSRDSGGIRPPGPYKDAQFPPKVSKKDSQYLYEIKQGIDRRRRIKKFHI
jgi:hypothetical protein